MTVDLSQFEVYIVGGYVRDRLLGLEAKDHDFVVCGATIEDMLNAGFSQVGAEFPVFLHPVTNDEFALARTERKTGPGYHGFECFFDPSVTIEEDLMRRDLTINAMARRVISFNEIGHAKLDDAVIDPFNGQQDLANSMIRHTSLAFQDDPVRVLRAARFAARYNFRIADETWDLMKWMVHDGELDHLTAERVWLELEKAMKGGHPGDFFNVLNVVGAIDVVLPLLKQHVEDVVCVVNKLRDRDERLALMTLGLGEKKIEQFFDDLKAPAEVKRRALKAEKLRSLLARWHLQPTLAVMNTTRHADELSAGACMNIFIELDALRMSDEFEFVVQAHNVFRPIPMIDRLLQAKDAFISVRFADLSEEQQRTLKGPDVGVALTELRSRRISKILQH